MLALPDASPADAPASRGPLLPLGPYEESEPPLDLWPRLAADWRRAGAGGASADGREAAAAAARGIWMAAGVLASPFAPSATRVGFGRRAAQVPLTLAEALGRAGEPAAAWVLRAVAAGFYDDGPPVGLRGGPAPAPDPATPADLARYVAQVRDRWAARRQAPLPDAVPAAVAREVWAAAEVMSRALVAALGAVPRGDGGPSPDDRAG